METSETEKGTSAFHRGIALGMFLAGVLFFSFGMGPKAQEVPRHALLVRNASGTLFVYPYRADEKSFGAPVEVGQGFHFTDYIFADFTGNAKKDLVVRNDKGELLLYPFRDRRFQGGTRVGQGFNFTHFFPADWQRDGKADLIVRSEDGDLFLYPFRDGRFPQSGIKVGEGFDFDDYAVTDW